MIDNTHVVVLKGAYTVVAGPDGRCHVIPFANPLLGAAGSGDVLAGVLAGLLAQGVGAYETAGLGAYLHGAGCFPVNWPTGCPKCAKRYWSNLDLL